VSHFARPVPGIKGNSTGDSGALQWGLLARRIRRGGPRIRRGRPKGKAGESDQSKDCDEGDQTAGGRRDLMWGPVCPAAQALDALQERAASGGQCQLWSVLADLLEIGKRPGVNDHVSTGGHSQIIAAVLAFDPDLAGNPPDSGMIKEQCLDESLEDVDEV